MLKTKTIWFHDSEPIQTQPSLVEEMAHKILEARVKLGLPTSIARCRELAKKYLEIED